jgi:hypothetical protein
VMINAHLNPVSFCFVNHPGRDHLGYHRITQLLRK